MKRMNDLILVSLPKTKPQWQGCNCTCTYNKVLFLYLKVAEQPKVIQHVLIIKRAFFPVLTQVKSTQLQTT